MATDSTTAKTALIPFVKRLRLHSKLSADDVDALLSLPWKFVRQSQNSHLVREGDVTRRCTVLVDGFVQRYRISHEGERQILAIYVQGDPIDFEHLYLPVADDGLQSIRDSVLACVDHASLRELMVQHPMIAEAVMCALLVDASIFREWTLNVGRRDARARIAHLFCEISTRLQAQGFEFDSKPLPLTQDQIADSTGLTPVHVNRTLKIMSAEQVIERRGGLVLLPDPRALREMAGFDARYLHMEGT